MKNITVRSSLSASRWQSHLLSWPALNCVTVLCLCMFYARPSVVRHTHWVNVALTQTGTRSHCSWSSTFDQLFDRLFAHFVLINTSSRCTLGLPPPSIHPILRPLYRVHIPPVTFASGPSTTDRTQSQPFWVDITCTQVQWVFGFEYFIYQFNCHESYVIVFEISPRIGQ